MKRVIVLFFLAVAMQCCGAAIGADGLPWTVNSPIVNVEKSLYRARPKSGGALMVSVGYVGPELERVEIHGQEMAGDLESDLSWRFSKDNGRTWTDLQPLYPRETQVDYKGISVRECRGTNFFDPESGLLLGVWLRQHAIGGLFHNASYWRLSGDHGRTWSEPQQFRYEEGDCFDPDNPLNASFLKHNQGYIGNNILRLSNGSLVFSLAAANALGDPDNDKRAWRMGSALFLGKWNAEAQAYDWTPGARVEISPEWSSRGLLEPEIAELKDGRLLIVWRGSNTSKTQGRKWFSVSTDGGRTLSEVKEWKYDDGSRFYSPSSYHRMIRHSVTGKLYWLGNICSAPPSDNAPRYPLVIAEVDETTAALKKNTVSVIDDRRPGQPANIELSNFGLLENRETHTLEIYLTAYGVDSSCYKYVATLK